MQNKKSFPWHYFVKTVRARIVLVVLSTLLTYVICQAYPVNQFDKVLLILILLIIVAIIQGYFRIIPFRDLLARIDSVQVKLPHNKKLNLIYQKDEWVLIQEMLKLTEKYIGEQQELLLVQEQQSQTLLESIVDPIIMVDSFLNCKHYNRVFKDKFIKDKQTKVYTEEKLWKIFEDEKIIDLFQWTKDRKESTQLLAYQIDDEYFDISITPIIDSYNQDIGMLGIFHNVTESKLTDKMRVDFVANVSHEIRTPLTSIKGFAQLLLAQKEMVPEMLHSPLERINSNTERLKDLFDNLLKLSVIESHYEIDIEELDLTKLLTQVKSNLKAKYQGKSIDIDIAPKIQAHGDIKLLEHVFTNLLDNSIKYNDKEIATIAINSRALDQSQEIVIKDNGPGIKGKELQRIFERFYRVQGQTTQAIEGTGLGLSIVKHIINKHQGEISVESEVNNGTTFTIKLPTN